MAYKVIILYRLYMPSYFLGTFTEYPQNKKQGVTLHPVSYFRKTNKSSVLFKAVGISQIFPVQIFSRK